MFTSTKSSCRFKLPGELKWDTVGQLSHLPVAFGEPDYCSIASTVHPISSGDNGWKINNKEGISRSSEGPGGNSHKSSAADHGRSWVCDFPSPLKHWISALGCVLCSVTSSPCDLTLSSGGVGSGWHVRCHCN